MCNKDGAKKVFWWQTNNGLEAGGEALGTDCSRSVNAGDREEARHREKAARIGWPLTLKEVSRRNQQYESAWKVATVLRHRFSAISFVRVYASDKPPGGKGL